MDCKKQISLDILGIEYDPKKFEKIGSRSEYLSKLYNISLDDSKKMKFNENKTNFFRCNLEGFIQKYGEDKGRIIYNNRVKKIKDKSHIYEKNLIKSNLEGFIEKFGKELGEEKYKDRCEKIAYTNTLDYYINRFGKEEGELRYKNKLKQTTISKKSLIVSNILTELNIEFITEKNIGTKSVDYYLPEYNMVLEYYGDYWHCNPKKYNYNFEHPQIKMTAEEIWNKDKNRLDNILKQVNSIIIIWESSNIDSVLIENTINNLKNKKTLLYI